MAIATLVVLLCEFAMLTVTRAHYVIDFTTAVPFGILIHRVGEMCSYYYDVALMGLPREKREAYWFLPCQKCGASNERAEMFMPRGEVELLQALQRKKSL